VFLKLLLIELGALLIYAGIKGKSVGKLIMGDNQTAATYPQGHISPTTVGAPSAQGK
jgi:hypothetical protein